MLRPVSTLLFAVLGRIVGLQIQNDSLSVVLRNRCAEGFVHLVHLGFPSRGGERRLHSDVARAVAGVAVNLDVLEAVPRNEIHSRHRIRRNLVVRIRQKLDRRGLPQASEFRWRVVAFFEFGVNDARRHRQAAHHRKNPSDSIFHGGSPLSSHFPPRFPASRSDSTDTLLDSRPARRAACCLFHRSRAQPANNALATFRSTPPPTCERSTLHGPLRVLPPSSSFPHHLKLPPRLWRQNH